MIADLYKFGPAWIIRPAPALFKIPRIAPGIKHLQVARRCNVERFPARQFNTGRDIVQLDIALMSVHYPQAIKLLGVKSGKCHTLKRPDHIIDFIRGRSIFIAESDNAAGVAPLIVNAVNQRFCPGWIA
jgi:hypothetical protein